MISTAGLDATARKGGRERTASMPHPLAAKPTASLSGLAGQAPAQQTLARSSTASTLRAAPTPMFT